MLRISYLGGTLSRKFNLLVVIHIHRTFYDTTPNTQLSEYKVHTKAIVNLILIYSLLSFFVHRHVVQRVISPTPGTALFNLVGSGSLLALFAAACSLEGGVMFALVTVLVEALAVN